MTSKSKYMRKFIMLENNGMEYPKGINNKGKGYVKLECRDNKGKILFNLDGLENIEGKVYKGSLLTKGDGKLMEVEVGIIEVNEKGKGSLEWRFNPKSVDGTGVAIEDFKYVLVKLCGDSKGDSAFIIPLAGYISERDGNLDFIVKELERNIKSTGIHNKEENKQVKPRESTKQEEKPLDRAIKEEEGLKEAPKEKKYNIGFRVREDNEDTEKEQQEVTENLKEPQEEIEKKEEGKDGLEKSDNNESEERKENNDEEDKKYSFQQEYEGKDKEEGVSDDKTVDNKEKAGEYQFIEVKDESDYFVKGKDKDYKDDIKHSNTNSNYRDNMNSYGHSVSQNRNMESIKSYSKHLSNYSMNILKFFEKVEPFNEELKGYTWWEIEYDSKNVYRGFLPFYNYIVNIRYPYPFMTRVTTCQSLMRKYNHYIFGVYEKDKEIKYYVYGIPGKLTREEQPFRGMTGFQTWIEKKGNEKERLGYWLLHIDAISGKIVNPLRPTPPKRFR